MKIIRRPATAAVAIVLGLVVLVVGATLTLARDGGWPWHASISGPVTTGSTTGSATGSATAEIIENDGTAHRFTGSSTDAREWLDRKQDELKNAYGISAKIAVGEALKPAGLALVLLGTALLFWRLVTVRRIGRRPEMPDKFV